METNLSTTHNYDLESIAMESAVFSPIKPGTEQDRAVRSAFVMLAKTAMGEQYHDCTVNLLEWAWSEDIFGPYTGPEYNKEGEYIGPCRVYAHPDSDKSCYRITLTRKKVNPNCSVN